MPDKDPANWTLFTWALALAMPFGGGLVNWYARIKAGHTKVFNIAELLGEVFTSGFVGLAMFMALSSFDQPAGLCAAAAGISGHMATRLLFAIERAVERRLEEFGEAGK